MISSTDLEQLAEIELQKEEDEEQGRHGYRPDTGPPAPRRVSFSQDTSHPYYDVARHGILQVTGDDNYGRKLVIFSSCLMPPSHQLNHHHLLQYLMYTLDQYVESDYTVVYFHHGLRSCNKPSLHWLRNAYREFDRKYKKNLKALYVVHPTNFIRIIWNIFQPLIRYGAQSSFYSNNLEYSIFQPLIRYGAQSSFYSNNLEYSIFQPLIRYGAQSSFYSNNLEYSIFQPLIRYGAQSSFYSNNLEYSIFQPLIRYGAQSSFYSNNLEYSIFLQ
ncbi:rho GTPase-activating protein 1-like isoform X2 [Oncorhynchus keta]|uniref:rho GTPase-activating protein 1-like isoform X2 n=1 Tax=Oncorhynchus keta TaxID=8018 RepID=UPI00227C607B|nr:rho GTPase-activating protein 1-like isoform X2 [Oncorhynchus keta]